jgi:putative flippase GtrA
MLMRLNALILNNATLIRQFSKFAVIGLLGFAVDSTFLYFGIHALDLTHVEAGFFSFPFAVTFTWIGNRIFTFRHAKHLPAAEQLTKFVIVCLIGLFFNRGTYALLDTYVPFIHTNWIIGLVAGTAVSMFFNFFASRKHVFGL